MTKPEKYRQIGMFILVLFGFGSFLSSWKDFQIIFNNPSVELVSTVFGILANFALNPLIWVGILLYRWADRIETPSLLSPWLKIIKIYGVFTLFVLLVMAYLIIKLNRVF